MKYKHTRKEIQKFLADWFVSKGIGIDDKNLIIDRLLAKQEDKPFLDTAKCKLCGGKPVSSYGYCMACLSCHDNLDTPSPLDSIEEIKEIGYGPYIHENASSNSLYIQRLWRNQNSLIKNQKIIINLLKNILKNN